MPSGVYERTDRQRAAHARAAWRGDAITTYSAAHKRAQRALAGEPCSRASFACSGQLEVALKHGTPPQFVRLGKWNEGRSAGMRFSVRAEDYIRLCKGHHVEYDRAG
jgi:hypothetical protein